MNRYILLLIVTIAGLTGFSQQPLYSLREVVKQYPGPDRGKQREIRDYLNAQNKVSPVEYFKPDTARYESTNQFGLVYTLPGDKMYCLKPYISPYSNFSPTPFTDPYQPIAPAKIPNALESKKLVFQSPAIEKEN